MRRIICFLLFFVLNITLAQDKKVITEEEYTVLQYKIQQNFNANVDSFLVYAYQMAKSNNNKHLAFANALMSPLLQMKSRTELSEEKYKKALFLNKILKVFYIFLILGIVTLLVKSNRDKNKANKKMSALIQELKASIEKEKDSNIKTILFESEKVELKTENASLCIDLAKENEIVEKLLGLENNLEYLNTDFTLAYVAKKIKTNTTYLSYVVNKRFGKSFREYTNELKINYAINKMITCNVYRKKSTQATAESVGFKNAGSFAKSFRKRTGVSPAQFANSI